jgi:malonyl-CoA O-methyltransferase
VGAIPVSAAEGYALWAETWDATASPIVALEERVLRPWIEGLRSRRAIDVGCGTGRWCARLGAIGVDASEAMLQQAANKGALAGRLAAADATALPIADGAADVVLCTLTLGHIAEAGRALREFARVLERGGTLVMSDFHPDAAAQGWRRTFRHNGQVYELENHAYGMDPLRSAVAGELTCLECREERFGEPERRVFERAGRPELFDAACARPALLLTRWRRL